MKNILVLFSFIFCSAAYGQDCNSPSTLLVFNFGIGMGKGIMTPQLKIGLWDNSNSYGMTAFVGYRDLEPLHQVGKSDTTKYGSALFGEFGYKMRISKVLLVHGYAGIDKFDKYLGADFMYEISWNVIVAASYRRGLFGGGIYLRLN
jgi:hypothetical protein